VDKLINTAKINPALLRSVLVLEIEKSHSFHAPSVGTKCGPYMDPSIYIFHFRH